MDDTNTPTNKTIYSCEFEVFGRVQRVFFRKCTKETADSLKIRGWCMNTAGGTVTGELEGSREKLLKMQHWLESVGSPTSKIERAKFTAMKEQPVAKYSSDFEVRRPKKKL